MQRINFGRIENLAIRGGDPQFDPLPRVIHDIKFGGKNGPRPGLQSDDCQLKAQVAELFAHLDGLRDGVITSLEVKHGLPFGMIVEGSAA